MIFIVNVIVIAIPISKGIICYWITITITNFLLDNERGIV